MKYVSTQIISRTERRKFAQTLVETRTAEAQMSACRWPGSWAEVIKRITNMDVVLFTLRGDAHATAIQ
jgi:hypothetical protein